MSEFEHQVIFELKSIQILIIGGVCLRPGAIEWCLNGASMVQLPKRAHSSLLFLRMPSASIISLLRYHQKPISFISYQREYFERKELWYLMIMV